jgi:hypothetical protein
MLVHWTSLTVKAVNMFPAPFFLALLIVTTPASLIFDGPITHGLVTATAAMSLAIVALLIRPGEAGFLATAIRPVAIVAAVPVLWMLVQVLPLDSIGLAHPIWQSAAAALGRPIAGSISIDPGATVISLARYLSTVAVAFVAAAVAVDRNRAGWILFVLTLATTLIALMLMVDGLGGLAFPHGGNGSGVVSGAATDCASLGVILAAVAALHTFERGRARPCQGGSTTRFWLTLAASLVAFETCCSALIVGATSHAYFAVACGGATLAAAIVIRRFRLGPWGLSAIVSVALVVAIAAVIFQPDSQKASLLLAFATHAPAQMIGLTQRILTETNWAGTGAGTFAAVLPIYRNIDELATGSIPPSAVAAIAIEMGKPFLLAILMATVVLVVTLVRGAVRRGRDSSYAMGGAGCVVAATLLAFGNAGIFSTPVSVITAAVVGMAIAQNKSRSIHQ